MKKLVLLDMDTFKELHRCVFEIGTLCKKIDYLHGQLEVLGIPLSNELLKQFEAPEQNE